MLWLSVLLLVLAQAPAEPFTSPPSKPEYGHGLTAETAKQGWIALFDGQSTYGWSDSKVDEGTISNGQTTSVFGVCELKGEATAAGELQIGETRLSIAAGQFSHTINAEHAAAIKLGPGLALRSLLLKPAGLQTKFNGRDLTGCKILKHPRRRDDQQTKWEVVDGGLHARGGPGAVELDGLYGDVVIQIEVRTRATLVNGGLFFRSIPGQFMNGYEAQLFNACYEQDPGRPARYSTGAIDDRLLARRLVSRDLEPFTMTVIAAGPHLATWVNGYQTVDWTDTRAKDENPREGLRLEPGTIQLQAHDVGTDIEFRQIWVGVLP